MKPRGQLGGALGEDLALARPPSRIVSLVPSDTYSLAILGAGDRLVGRTRYCVEPASLVHEVPELGGTKNADVGSIIDLKPDLVVANREENSRRDLERLARAGLSVYVSFPKTVRGGLAHLERLRGLLGVAGDPATNDLFARYDDSLRRAEARAVPRPVNTFFPIWMDPLMTIHGDTFISDALELAGARNVFADRARRYPLAADLGVAPASAEAIAAGRDTRYPRVRWDEVISRAPELVLLPDEPHAFGPEDAARFLALDVPAARPASGQAPAVVRVSGKDFSWYGAWSLEALERARAVVEGARGA